MKIHAFRLTRGMDLKKSIEIKPIPQVSTLAGFFSSHQSLV